MADVIVQEITKMVKTDVEQGMKYYSVLSALNNLELTNRQIQLLAFTAIRGTITPLSARQEFVELFDSSLNSIENIKGKLVRMGLIVKIGEMYKILPSIDLDFKKDIVLKIQLNRRE